MKSVVIQITFVLFLTHLKSDLNHHFLFFLIYFINIIKQRRHKRINNIKKNLKKYFYLN